VFNLHETFENPKRVVKKPPFSVRETGYAGFLIRVDIYFQTDEKSNLKVSTGTGTSNIISSVADPGCLSRIWIPDPDPANKRRKK
jgi:YEATS family